MASLIVQKVLSGKLPFEGLNNYQAINKLQLGISPGDLDCIGEIDVDEDQEDSIRMIVSDCWKKVPEDRPQCEEIVERLEACGLTRRLRNRAEEEYTSKSIQEFRDVMKENEDEPIDLENVKRIFSEVCSGVTVDGLISLFTDITRLKAQQTQPAELDARS
jgi:hypothetical protein